MYISEQLVRLLDIFLIHGLILLLWGQLATAVVVYFIISESASHLCVMDANLPAL